MKKKIIIYLNEFLKDNSFEFDFNDTIHSSFKMTVEAIQKEIPALEEVFINDLDQLDRSLEEILNDFTNSLIYEEETVFGHSISKYQALYVNDRLEQGFREYIKNKKRPLN